jgi:GNAT superfamily N-acetyltransferase
VRAILFTSWRYPRTLTNLIRMRGMLEALDSADEAKIAAQYPAHLHINLLPDFQRQGVGSRLITTFEDHLREFGVPGLHLGTSNYNHKALPFYLKHGYQVIQEVGPIPHPLLEDLHFLTLAKSLG